MKTYWWCLLVAASFVGFCQEPPVPAPVETAAREAQEKAAAELKVNKEVPLGLGGNVKLELVLIPSGKFLMGSPKSDKDRNGDEEPQHEVTIANAFYMGKYVVTQEQYEAVMGAHPSEFKGARNPVEKVSWDDAMEFSRKLDARTGKMVRLPTDAEWEYACRAGTQTRFYAGDAYAVLDRVGWYAKNSEDTTEPPGGRKPGAYGHTMWPNKVWYGKTSPVGLKEPNAWGLYDMHGNVWQWCQDHYGSYPAGAVADPQGPARGPTHVTRGGCFYNDARCCRSASRFGTETAKREPGIGFRVVVVAPKAP